MKKYLSLFLAGLVLLFSTGAFAADGDPILAPGSTEITTLGTIGTGTWQGTAIGDSYISSAATWNAKQSALTYPVTGVAAPTAGMLTKWGASGNTIVDGLLFGTMTDGKYCQYTTAAGLFCTISLTTSISLTGSDTEIPTTKAVRDGLNLRENQLSFTYPLVRNADTISFSSSATLTEIDYMEYATDGAAQAAYVQGYPDSYTKLLLHGDGLDASTTITDSSSGGKTVTAVGNAQLDTAQKKFGSASILFDGTGDYLTAEDSADWYFGADPFTIDTWVRFTTTYGSGAICGQWVDADNFWFFNVSSGIAYFTIKSGGTVKANYHTPLYSIPLANTWYHIELVRTGTNVYIFINGVSQSLTITTTISTNEVPDLAAVLDVGACGQTSATQFVMNGWLDEFRISKGIARHTSNFIPSIAPYAAVAQSYSEPSIKVQGDYSLKGVATTDSLTETLTKTVSFDLTGINTLKFDIRSTRTGSNLKIGIHDSGGTTSEKTPNITAANEWQTVTWDISAVADANKNDIDSIIVTVVNADADNTFYLDNFYYETPEDIFADADAYYVVTKAADAPANSVNLGAGSTGLLYSTVAAGVSTISTTNTATNATNAGITDDTTTNATMYPAWVTASTGNLPMKVSSTELTWNPSSRKFGLGYPGTGFSYLNTDNTGTLVVAPYNGILGFWNGIGAFEIDLYNVNTLATKLNTAGLYLPSGGVIDFNSANVVLTHTAGILTLGTGTLKITNPTNNATSVVTTDGTQTLSNKTLTAPVLGAATATSINSAVVGWTQTTGTFTATPASTSTITMTTDLTATWLVGMPIKYTIGGVDKFGIITAMAANLLTVAGAPLSGDVTALYLGDKNKATQISYDASVNVDGTANTTVLKTGTVATIKWAKPTAYLVYYDAYQTVHDTGTHGKVTVKINGTEVNTSAGGLVVAADTTTYATVVDIATAAYDVNRGEDVTLVVTAGSNGDGYGLRANMVFVTP